MTGTHSQAEHWQRLDEIFAAAVELPDDQRASYLDQATAGDTELRGAVERLLRADEQAQSFLQEPIESPWPSAPSDAAAPSDEVGGWIGPYKLLRHLGQGGMGAVYLGSRADQQYDRLVAIKLIRHGFESAEVRHRFLTERQALARLEHPNIARMYDGGTLDDGRPYLVMEYVAGRSVDQYCNHFELSIRDRLLLFGQICAAVQYAHQSLLVHRDIKPSNILVTDEGVPKLLDFGLAKPLASSGQAIDETRTGLRLLTPGYASPEQIRGQAITTATDVYSLGVLLYELLTGCRPYRLSGEETTGEIEQAICEQVPRRPSTVVGRADRAPGGDGDLTAAEQRATTPRRLVRQLRGDLDNIVLMALRKEPERRYTLVAHLAADLGRHLDRLPVRARPDTLLYRGQRFLQRNRLAAIAMTLILALTVAFVVALMEQVRATTEERDRSDQIAEFLLDTFEVSAPDAALGSNITARQLLDAGARRIGSELAGRPRLQATMLDTMGVAYHQLGLSAEAEALIEQSLEIRRQQFGPEHPEVAESLHNLAVVHHEAGEMDLARRQYQEALTMRRKLLGDGHLAVAESLEDLGIHYWWAGEFDQAEPMLQQSLAIRRQVFGKDHREIATVLSNLGVLQQQIGDPAAAEPLIREALDMRRRIFTGDHPDVMKSLVDLASLYLGAGDAAKALPLFQDALQMQRETMGETHPMFGNGLSYIAQCYEPLGRYEEAVEIYRRLIKLHHEIHETDHPNLLTASNNLAHVLHLMGDLDAAEALFRQTLQKRLEVFGEASPWVAQSRNSLGRLLRERGDLDAAEALFRQAMAGVAAALPEGHPARAYPSLEMARLLQDRGALTDSEELLRAGLGDLQRALASGHWRIAAVEAALGSNLAAQGRFAEAEPLLLASWPVLRDRRSDRDPRTRRAVRSLVELYHDWGQPEKAEDFAARLEGPVTRKLSFGAKSTGVDVESISNPNPVGGTPPAPSLDRGGS
ncbi:MAG: serine/threonine-protein kinase [Acidobacteriota bacterium]